MRHVLRDHARPRLTDPDRPLRSPHGGFRGARTLHERWGPRCEAGIGPGEGHRGRGDGLTPSGVGVEVGGWATPWGAWPASRRSKPRSSPDPT
ncbi:hypothetical protein SEA_JACKO_110 [Microbacterium phage Jacko]|nr:hypothetical protein SEA_JACKO_1 [Microbacterium phage Jacko]AXC37968.1 hypothetical protein SEA_JACKO_110 [Microbacterium phage Jacko]